MALSTLSAQPSVKGFLLPPPSLPTRVDYVFQVTNACCTLTQRPHCRNPLTSAVHLTQSAGSLEVRFRPKLQVLPRRTIPRAAIPAAGTIIAVSANWPTALALISSPGPVCPLPASHPQQGPVCSRAGPHKAKPRALSLGPMGWHDAGPCSRLGHGKQWASRRCTKGEHPSGRNQGCKWNSRLPSELMHEFVAMSAAPSRSSHTNKPLLGSAFEKCSQGVPRGGPQLGGG